MYRKDSSDGICIVCREFLIALDSVEVTPAAKADQHFNIFASANEPLASNPSMSPETHSISLFFLFSEVCRSLD